MTTGHLCKREHTKEGRCTGWRAGGAQQVHRLVVRWRYAADAGSAQEVHRLVVHRRYAADAGNA